MVQAPERLLYPMRRTRPKTEDDPGWERITWDEALSICASRLSAIRSESGPEAVAFAVTTKSGTGIADSIEWVDRFVRVFGSPNVAGAVDICNWHKDVAHRFTFGVGMPVADYANADVIILWGHNPTSTWLAQAGAIAKGRARGASLIVIDPRATPLAQSADVWLQVKPGTDAALALGLASLLIRSGGTDISFVRTWTNAPMLVREDNGHFLRACDLFADGGDAFIAWDVRRNEPMQYQVGHMLGDAEAGNLALHGAYPVVIRNGATLTCRPAFDLFADACHEWTPARVESVTGVPEASLRAAIDILAHQHKVAYHAWNGVGQSVNATQTERAIATLYALTGAFDDIGSNRILSKQPLNAVDSLSLISKKQLAKAFGVEERPLGPPAEGRVKPIDVYRSLATGLPYPVRALVGFGTNHLLTQGDTEEIRRGLESAEFHVHCDSVETPTARYADILLPVNLPWEREALRIGFEISEAANELIQLRPAAVAPRGEARSDLSIVFDLATRLGFGDEFFNGDIEAAWNHMLAPTGVTVGELRAQGGRITRKLSHPVRRYAVPRSDGIIPGFRTHTRRVELYSEHLLRYGHNPLPHHEASKADAVRFPFVLTSMKSGYFCHSQHHGVPSLRKRNSAPTISLHPKLAQRKGIKPRTWATVTSPYGRARFIAVLDDTLNEGVLAAEFGWWEVCETLGRPAFPVSGPTSSNFNALVSAVDRDPISGSVPHKAVACDIAPTNEHAPVAWTGTRPFVVTELRHEGAANLAIHMAPADDGMLPALLAGQYLRVHSATPTGQSIARAYSLTSTADRPHREYTICVGRAPLEEGAPSLSNLLHDRLRVGDRLDVEAPHGSFTIPIEASFPLVFFATGIGITPFMSVLETAASRGVRTPMLLLYGLGNSDSHAFARGLSELSEKLPQLRILRFYSSPLPGDSIDVHYDVKGRLSADHVDDEIVAAGARFYCCGSANMIDDVKSGLRKRGVLPFRVFSEPFVSQASSINVTRSCQVEFKRSKRSFTWTASEGTLLDCADRLGVPAPSGCRVGQCESCAVRIISGTTEQLQGAVPEDVDMVFTCQGIPATDLVLDL